MRHPLLLLFVFTTLSASVFAQKKSKAATASSTDVADSVYFSPVKYRLIGPFRGGRADAVSGSLKNKNTFYFGATRGGLLKTMDGGNNWKNVSDGNFGGGIGAHAVRPDDA